MGDRFYMIMMGLLRVEVDGAFIRICNPGESVGDLALADRRSKQSATIYAQDPCILAALSRPDYRRVSTMSHLPCLIWCAEMDACPS
eukprot:SAG31_NODE_1003_length_10447_cov_3.491593_14_plen_87_part_00